MRAWRGKVLWDSLFVRMLLLIWFKLIILRLLLYPSIDMGGMALDFASAVIVAGLTELLVPARIRNAFFWSLNGLISVILLAAALYYMHFGSIVTYTSLYGLKQVLQVSSSIRQSMHPELLLFFVDLVLAGIGWASRRWRMLGAWGDSALRLGRQTAIPVRRTSVAVIVIGAVVVSAMSIRAEGQVRNELVRAEKLGFFNYQSAFAWEAWENSREVWFDSPQQAAEQIERLQARYPYQSGEEETEPRLFGAYEGSNLIVIQLESLQTFAIGYTVDGKPVTPVLNELAATSFYFPRIYQQIGQGNTSDAEFLFNTSLYPVGSMPMSSAFGNRDLPSLPKLLSAEGYRTSTFHVNDVRFWSRDRLYPALGFERYYDRPYFDDDGFNAFGASDEQLYEVSLRELLKLSKEDRPFYAQVVTASNHHPFEMPEHKKRLKLDKDRFGDTQIAEYLESVAYADDALGQFIRGLKESGLWDSSIIVMYGDHAGLKPQYNDPQAVSDMLGIPYHPQLSRFNIPFLVHVPGQTEGETVRKVGGQLDLMPTVANLLGLPLADTGYVHFGRDLLNTERSVFGIRHYLPTGSFVNDEILFIPGEGFEDGQAVSLDSLQPVEDIEPYRNDYYYTLALMHASDEYMKVLPKREETLDQRSSTK